MADAKTIAKTMKKEQRAAKRAARRQTFSQVWQAFKLQRENDKALIPYMLLAFLGTLAVFFLIGYIFHNPWLFLILGIAVGVAVTMWTFSRRLQKNVYTRAAEQPGAAGWVLENLRNGFGIVWRAKSAVAMTTHMDFIHRVIGVSGIVLVGEGDERRLKPLFDQQEKRLRRLAPGIPVTRILVGEETGRIPLRKLQAHLTKMKRIYKKDVVYEISARIESMDTAPNQMQGLPKGPLPKGAKLSGMNRRARRQAER